MASTISMTRPFSRMRLGVSMPLSPLSLSTSIRMMLRQVCHQRRRGRTQQPVLCLPLHGGVERLKKLHFSAREDRNRHAVAVDEAIAGQCRQPGPRCQNSDEIERVGAGERDPLAGVWLTARLP